MSDPEDARISALAMLNAQTQAFYTIFTVLYRKGLLEQGEVQELLRGGVEWDELDLESARAMEVIAEQLDRIERGGKPVLGIIDGGKE